MVAIKHLLLTNWKNDNHITHRIKYLFFYSSCMHQNCNVVFNPTIQSFSNKIKIWNELLILCKHAIFNIEVWFHGFEPLSVIKFVILWPFFHNYNQFIRILKYQINNISNMWWPLPYWKSFSSDLQTYDAHHLTCKIFKIWKSLLMFYPQTQWIKI
jgi:hypothetical protein